MVLLITLTDACKGSNELVHNHTKRLCASFSPVATIGKFTAGFANNFAMAAFDSRATVHANSILHNLVGLHFNHEKLIGRRNFLSRLLLF